MTGGKWVSRLRQRGLWLFRMGVELIMLAIFELLNQGKRYARKPMVDGILFAAAAVQAADMPKQICRRYVQEASSCDEMQKSDKDTGCPTLNNFWMENKREISRRVNVHACFLSNVW